MRENCLCGMRQRERLLGSYETFVGSGRVGQLSDLMSESEERLFNIVVEAQEHTKRVCEG